MKIIKETALKDFEFWSGAKQLADYMTNEEFDIIEHWLEDISPSGLTETEINDLFWFDSDWICENIGYENFDKFLEERVK